MRSRIDINGRMFAVTYPGQQAATAAEPEPMDAKPTFEPEVFDGDEVFGEFWLQEQMYPLGRVERDPALDKIQGQIAEIRERHAKLKGDDEYEAVRWHFRVTMFPDRPPGKDEELDDAYYTTLLAYIANGKWLGALRMTNDKERRQKKIQVYATRIINHMSLIDTIVAYRTQLSEERQWQLLTELRRDMNPMQPDYKASSYATLLCKAYLIAYHYHDDAFLTKSVQRHVRAVMRPTSDNSSSPSPSPSPSPMNVTQQQSPTPLDRLRAFDDLAVPTSS